MSNMSSDIFRTWTSNLQRLGMTNSEANLFAEIRPSWYLYEAGALASYGVLFILARSCYRVSLEPQRER